MKKAVKLMLHTIPSAVWRYAKESPEQTAICSAEGQLSYKELRHYVCFLASVLRGAGVQEETFVGVAMQRSHWLPVALLAVMEAGGAYVPIDPRTPSERFSAMQQDAELLYVLTDDNTYSCTSFEVDTTCILSVDGDVTLQIKAQQQVHPCPPISSEWKEATLRADQLAYMMYTSGSTGVPKGAQIEHRSVCNVLDAFAKEMGVDQSTHTLSVLSASFDCSVLDMFLPLSQGATLEIAPQSWLADGPALAARLDAGDVNWFQATPPTMQMLVDAGWQPPASLRLLSGGELLPLDLAQALTVHGASLWNGYGITETSIYSTVRRVSHDDRDITIGLPIQQTSILICAPDGSPVPRGDEGEIVIAGVGVGRGYWNRPALNEAKFYEDPTQPEGMRRLYRSGDLARWPVDGDIVCLGRLDRQIKLRGHRIEVGEIESCLRAQPTIQNAVLVARSLSSSHLEMPEEGEANRWERTRYQDKQLLAYVTLRDPSTDTNDAWKQGLLDALAQKLPAYMIPSMILPLDAFPMTLSNKIDRNALPMPDFSQEQDTCQNEIEEQLCAWFQELLKLPSAGPTLDFFRAGGHSLLATRLATMVRETWSIPFPITQVFSSTTPRQIAEYVATAQADPGATNGLPLLTRASSDKATPVPLSFAQERLWFAQQLAPGNTEYNTTLLWKCRGLTPALVEQVLRSIVLRHDVLRTDFPVVEGVPHQRIHAELEWSLPFIDLSAVPADMQSQQIETQRKSLQSVPFTLDSAPLFRFLLLQCSQDGPELVLLGVIHHSLTDGWSHQVLFDEWLAGIRHAKEDHEPPEPLALQYADYARWQRDVLAGPHRDEWLASWTDTLAELPPQIALPLTRKRPTHRSVAGEALPFVLSASVSDAIRKLAQSRQMTPFMVLYAAFGAWLAQRTQQRDIPVGTLVANRNQQALESLIGYIANTLVLRGSYDASLSFAEALQQARAVVLHALTHQSLPFSLLVQSLRVSRNADNQPLFQVCFVVQEPPALSHEEGDWSFSMEEVTDGTSAFDWLVQLWPVGHGFEGSFIYRTDCFERETQEELLASFLDALDTWVTAPALALGEWVDPACSQAEAILQAHTAVADAVVRHRPDGELVSMVGYVVSEASIETLRHDTGLDSIEWVRVHRIPRMASGLVDEARLLEIPVVSGARVQQLASFVERLPEVADVSCSLVSFRPAPRWVHDEELLPPLRTNVEAGATTAVAHGVPKASKLPAGMPSVLDGGALVCPDDAPDTLRACLERAARLVPSRGITNAERDGSEEYLSFSDLLRDATKVAFQLKQKGVEPGSIVLIQCPYDGTFLRSIWGCWLGGFVALPMACAGRYTIQQAAAHKVLGVWKSLDAPVVLASHEAIEGCRALLTEYGEAEEAPCVLACQELIDAEGDVTLTHEPMPDDLVLLLLTSGSTGVPKPVRHHHRTLLAFLEGYKQRHDYTSEDRFLNMLGMDHVGPLLMCHLSSVYSLASSVNRRFGSFQAKPTRLLDWVEAYQATTAFMPNFGFGELVAQAEEIEQGEWDLSSMRVWINGGELVNPRTVRQFLSLLSPHGLDTGAMVPVWGMSETSSATVTSLQVSLDTVGESDDFVSMGFPIPGFQVRVVDDENQCLPQGHIGHLQTTGLSMMSGYHERPEANAESTTEDGWFVTGDLAYIDETGLVLTGRSKDQLIVHGTNTSCQEVEAAIERGAPAHFKQSIVFGIRPPDSDTDLIVVLLPIESDDSALLRSLYEHTHRALKTHLGVAPAHVVPVSYEQLPRTEIGKIQRSKLRDMWEQGAFASARRACDIALQTEQVSLNWTFRRVWHQTRAHLPLVTTEQEPLALLAGEASVGWGQDVLPALGTSGWKGLVLPALDNGSEQSMSSEAYRASLQQTLAAAAIPRPRCLIHVWSSATMSTDAPHSEEAFARQHEQIHESLLACMQETAARWTPSEDAPIQILSFVLSASGEGLDWSQSSVYGMLSSVHHEWPGWKARQIVCHPDALASVLSQELSIAPRFSWEEVRYQDDERKEAGWVHVDWSQEPADSFPFQEGDFVLMTGGLGGMGTRIAKEWLARYGCRLLLVGRRSLLDAQTSTERTAQRRYESWQQLNHAQHASPFVRAACMYVQHDIRDAAGLMALVERYEAQWETKLKGILHLASSLRDAPLSKETTTGANEVYDAKGRGYSSIHAVMQARPSVRFVDFGTINEWFGGYGVSSYAGGSRVGEAFSRQMRGFGYDATHISWSAWSATGMSHGLPLARQAETRGYLTIAPEKGLQMLSACLLRPAGDWVIGLDSTHPHIAPHCVDGSPAKEQWDIEIVHRGPGDEQAIRERLEEAHLLPEGGMSLSFRLQEQAQAESLVVQRTMHEPSPLASEHQAVIASLRSIWLELLSLKKVGLDQNFFELGGHSMLLGVMQERIASTFGIDIPMISFFRASTIRLLAEEIAKELAPASAVAASEAGVAELARPVVPLSPAPPALPVAPAVHVKRTPRDTREGEGRRPLAVVGMAGRFPGAPDLDAFWKNLVGGVESMTTFSEEELAAAGIPEKVFKHPQFVPKRGVIDDPEWFDAGFFSVSPKQAALTDPQQRLLLEAAWHCLEDAACDPSTYPGRIGVFAGCSTNTYLYNNLLTDRLNLASLGGTQSIISSDKDHLATLISYKLNLRGPSVCVQTACSTSLVALHLGCNSIWMGDSDMVLVGASSLLVPVAGGHLYRQGFIYSEDGHCRPFDARAGGTVSGDGVAVVAIKPLDDALEAGDPIRAVIRGTAINNDGHQKIAYIAPSIDAQSDAIIRAHQVAGVDPATVSYVETHGTGTALGDPVEVAALTRAFQKGNASTNGCALGSVKANIGHLNAAAGLAGFVKTVLALENKWLPPQPDFRSPLPALDLHRSPFYVNARSKAWESASPRRAGVSSFGAGGTNAHVVLEEAPEVGRYVCSSRPVRLTLSAKSPKALEQMAQDLGSHLLQYPESSLEQVASTLAYGRTTWPHRLSFVGRSAGEAGQLLSQVGTQSVAHCQMGVASEFTPQLVFVFPAQGTQKVNMALSLYRHHPVFRETMERCFAIVQDVQQHDLRRILYPEEGADLEACQAELDDQLHAGPALFSVCYSLAKVWASRGIEPDVMIGHSTGEYVAACLAGVFSLETAITLMVKRARLIDSAPAGRGIFIPMSPDAISTYLDDDQYIALQNAPEACVVTGEHEPMDRLEARMKEHSLPYKYVRLSCPAHTPLFDDIAATYEKEVAGVALQAPSCRLISGLTGEWLEAKDVTNTAYWSRHLNGTIRFSKAMDTLGELSDCVVVELGPHRSMQPLVQMSLPAQQVLHTVPLASSYRMASAEDVEQWFLHVEGGMWTQGRAMPGEAPAYLHKLRLPVYPFQRQKFWIEPVGKVLPTMANLGEEGFSWSDEDVRSNGLARSQVTLPNGATGSNEQALKGFARPSLATPYRAPTNPVESLIAEIAAELLDLQQVGVDDSFLELGADSLIALRIMTQLREKYDIAMPQSAMFDGLTVARLAMHVKDKEAFASQLGAVARPVVVSTVPDVVDESVGAMPPEFRELVVPLRETGHLPPLFLIHPAAGVIFPYMELAKQIHPDRPVYAIQARGLDGRRDPDLTCEAMAARYCAFVRYIQPEGPYHIVGYSFGCYVAYEMALLFKNEGRQVGFLGLLDEYAPIDGYRITWADVARMLLSRSSRSLLRHFGDYVSLGWKKRGKTDVLEAGAPLPTNGPLRRVWERSVMAALLPQETHGLLLDQPAMRTMFDLFLLHTQLCFSYAPPAYDGDVTLFTSTWTANRWGQRRPLTPDLGWEKLVSGRVDVIPCQGDHLAMIRQPYVMGLAQELERALMRATN